MYRVAKKTTKNTEFKCLECKHVKADSLKKEKWGCMVECNAPNRCLTSKFNAKDYYCVEYKGFKDMSESEKENLHNKIMKEYSDSKFKEYVKKYYPKEQAKKMIEQRKNKNI